MRDRDRRIAILFTIPNFLTAGSGREMLQIIQRLNRDRFAATICVLRRGGALEAEAEGVGIPVIQGPFAIPVHPLFSLPVRLLRAAKVFRSYRFDVWHSFNWSSDYTEPLIARLSGTRAWVYTKKNMGWERRAWRLRTIFASAVMARNRDMMKRFFDRRPYRKARLIWGGVDVGRFAMAGAEPLPVALTESRQPGMTVVTCVAQLVRVKGHSTLIKAVAGLEGTMLYLAGAAVDPEYVRELHDLVQTLRLQKRVLFLGPLSDVRPLLSETDIFVLPTSAVGSHEEGCPAALLEAMAMGRACLASDVAGSRDIVEHRSSGILVRPDNPGAMAAALEELIASPALRETLGRKGRERVELHFGLDKESGEVAALYEDILA